LKEIAKNWNDVQKKQALILTQKYFKGVFDGNTNAWTLGQDLANMEKYITSTK